MNRGKGCPDCSALRQPAMKSLLCCRGRPWSMVLVVYGFPTKVLTLCACLLVPAHAHCSTLLHLAAPPSQKLGVRDASPNDGRCRALTGALTILHVLQIQALQFEWAWQHPDKSKIVRDDVAALMASSKRPGIMGAKGKARLKFLS